MQLVIMAVGLLSVMPAYAGGVTCPAGMRALDIQLATDPALFKDVILPGSTDSFRMDPMGWTFLSVSSSKDGTQHTSVDPNGEYRGCVHLDKDGSVYVTLVADILNNGRSSRTERVLGITVPESGDAEIIRSLEYAVDRAAWNATSGMVVRPYAGVTITIRPATR